MTTFSTPEDWIASMKQIEKMNEDLKSVLPHEMSSAANLFVHPLAGAAAMSALSIGLASHAFGIWFGTLTSAAEASQRLLKPLGDSDADVAAFSAEPKSPEVRARAAAKTLMADVQSIVDTAAEIVSDAIEEVQEFVEPVVEPVAEAVEQAIEPAPESVADVPKAEAAAAIMPEDFRQPKAIDKPDGPDDLKAISGIGPKLETVLNGLGIWTYGQIAAWTAEEVAWVDDYLSFKGRIGRDGWIEQAKGLAAPVGSVH